MLEQERPLHLHRYSPRYESGHVYANPAAIEQQEFGHQIVSQFNDYLDTIAYATSSLFTGLPLTPEIQAR
jgi:hypothetical protein